MAGYTKLFERILDSTIWREEDPTRILWIAMLALADQDGIVSCTIPGLADRARITLDQCERALQQFQQPDKYSWSQEKEGRRIEPVNGGWRLINHAKFRALMSAEELREKTRIRVAKWRERQKDVTVTKSNAGNDKQKQKHSKHMGSNKSSIVNTDSKGGDFVEVIKINPPSPLFTQSDFDERDLRKLCSAETTLANQLKASIGTETITDQEFFTTVCEMAGISVERGLKLKEMQRRWPKGNGGGNA